jgi:hypothetical protein
LIAYQWQDMAHMVAQAAGTRRRIRYTLQSAVQRMSKQAALGVIQRDTSFIARGFYAQDQFHDGSASTNNGLNEAHIGRICER